MTFVFALGCGPAVAEVPEAAGDESSTTDAETGADTREVPADPSDTGEFGSTSGAGDDSTTDEPDLDTGESGQDVEDPYECGCEDNVVIGFDEVTEGHSASSILASLQTSELPWEWLAFEGSPTETVLHISVAYNGDQVLQGPGGDNGCGFLSAPCPGAFIIPVDVTFTTDDGILAGAASGTIEVDMDFSADAQLRIEPTQMQLGGMFGEQVIVGQEGDVTEMTIEMRWSLDGEWDGGYLAGNLPLGYDLIGRSL